jgi:hypothetical protein
MIPSCVQLKPRYAVCIMLACVFVCVQIAGFPWTLLEHNVKLPLITLKTSNYGKAAQFVPYEHVHYLYLLWSYSFACSHLEQSYAMYGYICNNISHEKSQLPCAYSTRACYSLMYTLLLHAGGCHEQHQNMCTRFQELPSEFTQQER